MSIVLPMFFRNTILFSLASVSLVHGQGRADFWDLPPIRYSDTASADPLAALIEKVERGEVPSESGNGLKRLKFVLKYLDVPPESQALVFSKTSLQNRLIGPENPRCLYFSENAYVGYVPGGSIEAIVHDAVLGPVFYLIDQKRDGSLNIQRDRSECLSCHATSRTENVPGVLIRSVKVGEDGHALLHLGTDDVNHETPVEHRWGGWYVTGESSKPHLGNRIFKDDGDVDPRNKTVKNLKGFFDTSGYVRETSDIVSLLVLEHQVKMHNLFNAASMNFRRASHFMRALDPEADPMSGSTGRMAESWADEIVDCLFFKNEADLGDGVEGDQSFQDTFLKRFPKTSDGDSLAEFKLYGRIFKNRCSYMVYSDAFKGLPPMLKEIVLRKMRLVIDGESKDVDWLKGSELKRIDAILKETLPEWS
ncbi:MAG: hypothetical protein AB8D78_08635 [Akkermansiaceae bacterium]